MYKTKMMKSLQLKIMSSLKWSVLACSSIFITTKVNAQFDTIPTNKGPKASYATWKYTAGVTDVLDVANPTLHSSPNAYELKGNNVDIIYAPKVQVTSNGSVTGTVKFNLVNFQEGTSVGQVAVSVLVDGGTANAITYSAFTTASGTNSWKPFQFSGNFLAGTHTYQAFFSNPSGNPVTVDDLNFGFTGATSVTLPVTLGDFSARKAGNEINLYWNTVTEINNKGFYVERSNDGGKSFGTIGFVPTAANNGNSNSNISYSYTDAVPQNGDNYYRLKQMDKDGATTYSQVVVIVASINSLSIKIYPNPTTNYLNITGVEIGAITKVINIAGQTVSSTVLSSNNLDVSKLVPGMYVLQVISANKTESVKFIKK